MEHQYHKYNEEFAIPEMTKTFKSLSNRLQRDFVFLIVILFYIVIGKPIKLPFIDYTFDYSGMNIIYILLIFIFFYVSIIMHMLKIYILYRQIDDEVKMFYSPSYDNIYDKIDCASHMTSFVISENIIADLILTGHKRHPSLRRIIFWQALIMLIAIFVTWKMLYDFKGYLGGFLIVSFIGHLLFQYFAIRYHFIKRSAFLNKTQFGKMAFKTYIELITMLNKYTNDSKLEKLKEMLSKKTNDLLKFEFGNIFDDDWHMNFLGESLSEIKNEIDNLSDDEKAAIMYYEAFEEADKSLDSKSKFKLDSALDSYNSFKNKSEYALALHYHSRHSYDCNPQNIFKYLYFALSK